jgi:DNA-binding CsgD family transcriptional regulator
MLRTVTDLRAVLDFAAQAVALDDWGQVRSVLLAGLAGVVGGDAVTLTHLDLRTQREVAVFWPVQPAAETLGCYPDVGAEHPLRSPLREMAAGRAPLEPVRISDVLSHRAWRRTPVYDCALRGTADQMSLPLAVHGGAVHAVSLRRSGGTFTDRQRDLLAACAAHLRAVTDRLRRSEAPALQISPTPAWVPLGTAPGVAPPLPVAGLSPREREVLELVASGLTDAQVARRLGLRPATVSRHLHRIYARHDVPNRAAAARLLNLT